MNVEMDISKNQWRSTGGQVISKFVFQKIKKKSVVKIHSFLKSDGDTNKI